MEKMLQFFRVEGGLKSLNEASWPHFVVLGCAVAIVVLTGGVSAFFNNMAVWFNDAGDNLPGVPGAGG